MSGSGTGTFRQDSLGPYNELQAGSYVFMDADYARILDHEGNGPDFEPSLFVLATVISVNGPGQVTIDAGTKALATNGPPPSSLRGAPPGSTYRFAGDEHGLIVHPPAAVAPALGARVLIGATHCDPTVNLHGLMHAVSGNRCQRWHVRARHGDP
jgi:D-serine deaminase-like pyridoxal phosphate-dependent protein